MPDIFRVLITYLVWTMIALFIVFGLFWILAQVGIVAWEIFNIIFKVVIAIGVIAGLLYLLRAFGVIK